MHTVDVISLLYDDEIIGYRLSNNDSTYDISKALFENVCEKESLDINIISQESTVHGNGIYKTSIDNAIEISNRQLIKLILNDIGIIKLGIYSKTGSSLNSFISKVGGYKERDCISDIKNFLNSSACNLLALFGVRRTGKTILMYQTIKRLVESGVSTNDIYYLSIEKDKMSSDNLYCYVTAILNSNIKYLFVDEITYCKDNIDFTSIFSEKYVDKKIIIAGTDSAVFLKPFESFLYDRVSVISTSYISYKEYNKLYGSDIKEYLKAGGILKNSRSYISTHDFDIEKYIKNGDDYFNTSIIDNIFSSFEKYDLSSDFPELQNLYYRDKNNLRCMLIKWLKSYGLELTLRVLRKDYKSGDIGNLKDICQRRFDFDAERLVDFFNKYEELYKNCIRFKDKKDFTESQIIELKSFLKKINCLISISDINAEYIVPIVFRYALYCDAVLVLQENRDKLSQVLGTEVDINEFGKIMLNTLEGELYEGIIYTDLKQSGVSYRKFRHSDNEEIDLIIDNDLYEIKHSSEIVAGQCRWLLNEDFTNSLNPKSFNVIYSGNTTDVEFSQKDAIESIINSGKTYSPRLNEEYSHASEKKKVVHYINIEEFLKNIK